jgi:glyoxylase-like metal-dependent hydrolase (beta-lactamase superfamily II)
VHSDIFKIPVPLPNNPLKCLNTYLIRGAERSILVDLGFNAPECKQALDRGLESLGISWNDVDVFLTHSHFDHTGNIDRVYQKDMVMYANFNSLEEPHIYAESRFNVIAALLSQEQQGETRSIVDAIPLLHYSPKLRPEFKRLVEGDALRVGIYQFVVIKTPGHDPFHLCLYEPYYKIMLLGDLVLDKISPTVLSFSLSDDNLSLYLSSLQKIRNYQVDLALPAHGETLKSLPLRVDKIIEHHEHRAHELHSLVKSGLTDLSDITAAVHWNNPIPNWADWSLEQKYFSLGETFAHLVYLVRKEKLVLKSYGEFYRFAQVEDAWT